MIQSSTRRFSVTEIGHIYYAHCRAMLVEAEGAQAAVEQTRAEPCGTVRLSCPVALLHTRVAAMLVVFMAAYPRVDVQLEATNRRVDVIAEGFDIAIRVRPAPFEDSDLHLKVLAESGQTLVASPALLARTHDVAVPADLADLPSLDLDFPRPEHVWTLEGPDGASAAIRHHPRLVTDDMIALRAAAVAGIGVLQLPRLMLCEEVRDGHLVRLLPDWAPRSQTVHAVYPSQRGLLPSVRALLDELGQRFAEIAPG